MTVSPYLEVPQVSQGQADSHTTLNSAIAYTASAIAAQLNLVTVAATSSFTLPYDDTNDLSPRNALRFIRLSITGAADQVFDVIHPDSPHVFAVTNNTTQIATIKTAAGAGAAIGAGQSAWLYCDGTDVIVLVDAGSASIPTALKTDETAVLTVGYTTVSYDNGNIAASFTPDPTLGQVQHYSNNGAHPLVPFGATSMITLDMLNTATAGVVDTNAFDKVTGDALTTVDGDLFRMVISNGFAGSCLDIRSMQ